MSSADIRNFTTTSESLDALQDDERYSPAEFARLLTAIGEL